MGFSPILCIILFFSTSELYSAASSFSNLLSEEQALTFRPTEELSCFPTAHPTSYPTSVPTTHPGISPNSYSYEVPTSLPSLDPNRKPSFKPTTLKPIPRKPTIKPTTRPTIKPTVKPSVRPTLKPSPKPTYAPTSHPTSHPTAHPTAHPRCFPTSHPTSRPTQFPSSRPTSFPTLIPILSSSTVFLSGIKDGSLFLVLSGTIFWVALLMIGFVLFVRTSDTQYLDSLHSSLLMLCDLGLICFLIGVSIYQLVASVGNTAAFFLLLFARIIVGSTWCYLMYLFIEPLLYLRGSRGSDNHQNSNPQSDLEVASVASQQVHRSIDFSSYESVSKAELYQLTVPIYRTGGTRRIVSAFVIVLCMVDGTLSRLFPCARSVITTKLGGYPKVFFFRVCIHSTTIAQLVQLIATLLQRRVNGDNADPSSWKGIANTVIIIILVVMMAKNLIVILNAEILIRGDENFKLRDNAERYNDDLSSAHFMNENPMSASARRLLSSSPDANPQGIQLAMQSVSESKSGSGQTRPLHELQDEIEEIQSMIQRVTAGTATSEEQFELDNLLNLLAEQKKQDTLQWRKEQEDFAQACLQEMRNYIPSYIFKTTKKQLIEEDGMHPSIAEHLFTKKCLWLVRMTSQELSKITITELNDRFNYEGEELDLVELMAIYAILPEEFPSDPKQLKEKWKFNLEKKLKVFIRNKEEGRLTSEELRNPLYSKQEGLYDPRKTLSFYLQSGQRKSTKEEKKPETVPIQSGMIEREQKEEKESQHLSVYNILMQQQQQQQQQQKEAIVEPSPLHPTLLLVETNSNKEDVENDLLRSRAILRESIDENQKGAGNELKEEVGNTSNEIETNLDHEQMEEEFNENSEEQKSDNQNQ